MRLLGHTLRWPGRGIPFILVGMSFLPQSRAGRWGMLGAGVLLCGIAMDATLVEPSWIEVVRSVEYLPMIRPLAPDLTLVHISDIHIASLGYRERRAIEIIDDAHPDIIVISGDLVRGPDHPEELRSFLGALRSRYGKFLVWGNHDYWNRVPGTWGPEIVESAGFTLLRNSSRTIVYPGGKIVIAGLDDPVTGRDNLRLAMARVTRSDACILVAHTPDIVRNLGNWDIDLVLAGHTHGGQVRLPIVGALSIPCASRDHQDGWYDVPRDVRLHVSRGLGWSWLPVRFLCRPTIDIITLRAGTAPGKGARSIIGQS